MKRLLIISMLLLVGCSGTPLTPSTAAPVPLSPVNGAVIPFTSQPIVLVMANGVTTTGVQPPFYTVDLAFDVGFFTQISTTVPVGAGGRTSLYLIPLYPNTYYWRVRMGEVLYSQVFHFQVK